jgi:hypothetical protein
MEFKLARAMDISHVSEKEHRAGFMTEEIEFLERIRTEMFDKFSEFVGRIGNAHFIQHCKVYLGSVRVVEHPVDYRPPLFKEEAWVVEYTSPKNTHFMFIMKVRTNSRNVWCVLNKYENPRHEERDLCFCLECGIYHGERFDNQTFGEMLKVGM